MSERATAQLYGWSLGGLFIAMLVLSGAFDNVSVVIRHTLIQLLTPDKMRGLLARAGMECIDVEGIAFSPTRVRFAAKVPPCIWSPSPIE